MPGPGGPGGPGGPELPGGPWRGARTWRGEGDQGTGPDAGYTSMVTPYNKGTFINHELTLVDEVIIILIYHS